MNHPGYASKLDAVQYQFGGLKITEAQAREHTEGWDYVKEMDFDNKERWANWWGPQWVRTEWPKEKQTLEQETLQESIAGLPDFLTESRQSVDLPPFLQRKWAAEGRDFSSWVNPSALKYRKNLGIAPSDYVIKWIASWVEEFGIDGFRCDVLDNVNAFRWKQLIDACNIALSQWRDKHKESSASKWTSPFWTTGDIWDANYQYNEKYAQLGFNSIVNFTFPKDGDLDKIGAIWQEYADYFNAHKNWSTLSFLNYTYKRDVDIYNMVNCGTCFLLSPSAIQIFYGDEVARQKGAGAQTSDPLQGNRSDYIWGQNPDVLKHWQKLGSFRQKHPAVALGRQTTLKDKTYSRHYQQDGKEDRVVIKIAATKETDVYLGDLFQENTQVRNAYTGESCLVKNHQAHFKVENNIVLVEGI